MINRLSTLKKGYYRIVEIPTVGNIETRLLEAGFLPNRCLYIICNNSLGIQVRINGATYFLNEVIASMIYIEPME